MNEITNIENSLEASTAKDNLLDIIGGAADYSIEKFLDMGDGIPIVSYLTKGVKTTLAIRDYIFMEKVIEFLREVGKEPTSSRKKMIDKIQGDSEYSQKFGKVSLVAIERFDDVEKAKLLGQTARYLARDEISFSMYRRVAHIIDRLYIADILTFANTDFDRLMYLKFITDLEALGLVKSNYGLESRYSSEEANDRENSIFYTANNTDLGTLIKCILRNESMDAQRPQGPDVTESFVEAIKKRYP